MRDLIPKLERLLRKHRQRVFDQNGDAHERAIGSLKRTATFRALCDRNDECLKRREDARLEGMGY